MSGFSFRSATGVDVAIKPDADYGEVVHESQEIGAILDGNTRAFNDHDPYQRTKHLGTHVASIPIAVWMDWKRQGFVGAPGTIIDDKKFAAALNDYQNRKLRTAPGRV